MKMQDVVADILAMAAFIAAMVTLTLIIVSI